MRFAIIATWLLLSSSSATQAEAPASLPPAASAAAEHLLTQFKMGKASDAFHDALREVEPQIGEQSFDSGAAQAGALLKTFGDVIDWSKYETDWITPTLIRQTYYVRSTNVPFFLTVLFYDTGKGWHIIDIQMNSYNNGKVAGYYDTVHQAQ